MWRMVGRFWLLCSDNRAKWRVLDVVRYALSVTKAKGSVNRPVKSWPSKHPIQNDEAQRKRARSAEETALFLLCTKPRLLFSN